MKQIQPITIWSNGQQLTGNWLLAKVINDNLKDTAIFLWQIFQNDNIETPITQGNLTMSGQDYIDWNNETDINDAAYIWIAQQLNLTII